MVKLVFQDYYNQSLLVLWRIILVNSAYDNVVTLLMEWLCSHKTTLIESLQRKVEICEKWRLIFCFLKYNFLAVASTPLSAEAAADDAAPQDIKISTSMHKHTRS